MNILRQRILQRSIFLLIQINHMSCEYKDNNFSDANIIWNIYLKILPKRKGMHIKTKTNFNSNLNILLLESIALLYVK